MNGIRIRHERTKQLAVIFKIENGMFYYVEEDSKAFNNMTFDHLSSYWGFVELV